MRLPAIAVFLFAQSVAVAENGVQAAVDAAFGNREGTAVVVEIATGKVVASHRLDMASRTLASPGSTVKPFVLQALRERGAANLRLACPGRLQIGSKRLDCSHLPLTEPVDSHRAIVYSCNNWFAEASRRLSADDLRRTYLRFGFSSAVELASDDNAKRLQALGEAGVRVTPLELVAAYRKLALMENSELANDLAGAAEFGTAQLAQPLGMSVAAKTGTTADGAWLAGWIPAVKPQYALVVYLPSGSGGSDAAPVARQIFTSLAAPDSLSVKVSRDGHVFTLRLEEYVAGVVAGEAGAMRSRQSQKAMAVAARTWASALRGRHKSEGFDFCTTTHCQNYRPTEISPAAIAATKETAGELLWFEGRPALTYYSGDCGGVTEAAKYVWSGVDAPYLKQQDDPWCRSHGRNEWRAEIEKTALRNSLRKEGLPSPAAIGQVRVLSRTPSGRVEKIGIDGTTMAGSAFRFAMGRQLGWNLIRSNAFDVQNEGSRVIVRGIGSGHGAGLCQTGAANMGKEGKSYREILAFYYPGMLLGRSARGLQWTPLNGERVRILSSRPRQDEGAVARMDRMAAEIELRTGLRFRAKPDVQFFPDAATYRDATGEPGWVAGSTRANVIRLQPGVGDNVVRHELMHELVEQNAAPGLPLWFREGIVLYLDNPQKPVSQAPSNDIAHAQSKQEMQAAYETARSRVKRLVIEHGEPAILRAITHGLAPGWNAPATPTR